MTLRHFTTLSQTAAHFATVFSTIVYSLNLSDTADLGVVDYCKSNHSDWVEPQTVDFYSVDLDLILLSDHNDNFSKYNPKKMLHTTALMLFIRTQNHQCTISADFI